MAISTNIGEPFARGGDAALAEIRPRRSARGWFSGGDLTGFRSHGGTPIAGWFRMETPNINRN